VMAAINHNYTVLLLLLLTTEPKTINIASSNWFIPIVVIATENVSSKSRK
jgi:hypothetical protein